MLLLHKISLSDLLTIVIGGTAVTERHKSWHVYAVFMIE
jgi:hypothetical protein